jgi:hypothetical protein
MELNTQQMFASIALLPELLESLKWALGELNCDRESEQAEWLAEYNKAQSLLERATGESK